MSKKLNHSLALGIFLIGLFSANVSQAQTATGATWDNTGSEWTNGASWIGDNAPTNSSSTVGNVATFSNAAVGFNTVNLGAAQSIYGVVFTAGANAYTFNGSALNIRGTATSISNGSTSIQTFNNKIINNANSSAIYGSVAGGSLVFAGGIDISSNTTARAITFGQAGGITVSSAIADGGGSTGGGVTVANTGLTIFSGNNTYSGTTTVSSGATLRLGSASALGTINGATAVTGALDLNGQTIGQEALSISGTGVSLSGSLFNSSSSAASWSGNIAQTASSTIKATNGSIGISGGINLNGDGATSRTLTLDGTGGIVLSGNISNSFAGSTGNIAIAATASNVRLSGNNSYNGTTTLNSGGGVNINSANAISTNTLSIGTSSFLNNTSGGAITNLGNNNITLGDTLTFGTSGSTAANSLNLGTGTVTASTSRTITIAGTGVTLGLGTLDSISTSSARTFTADGASNTLSLAGWKIQSGSSSNVVAKLAGSANWTIGGPILNGNAFSNGVQIDATGLTTFGGNNTYDGTTSISTNATLRITSATGLGSTNTGTTVDTGGQLQLSGGITVSAGEALSLSGGAGSRATLRNISGANTYNGAITFNSGTNRIDSDAGTLTLSSFAGTLAGTRSLLVGGAGDTTFTGRFTGTGAGTLTKDGAGTLTLANTNFDIGGGVLVNSGKLALAATNALGAIRAVAINGGTLDITTFDNTVGAVTLTNGTIAGTTGVLTGTSYAVESGTISAILGGSGALTKSGSGAATLSGSNSYSGLTAVNGGTLTLSGNNSAASGGVQVDASTLNINNTNALGTGTLRLLAASAILNNTSGGAITNAGNNAVIWQGSTFAFGTASNTANNNLNLGSGAVSVDSGRTLNLLGTDTKLTMGTITSSSAATTGISYNINGPGNTLVLGGLNIRSAGTTNVIDNLDGTANITINGAITDGNAFANGLKIKSTGTTTFSGDNTYTGVTEIIADATVKLGSSTALGSTNGATAVSSGGLLDLNGQTIAETLNYIGTGGLLNSAAGAATVSGVVDIASGMTINTTGNITLSGKLTGSSNKNLTKSGAGTLKFSAGNSDFAGITTVSEGTLLVTSAGNVSSSSSIVNSGGTLRVNGTAGGVTVNAGGILEGSGTVGTTTVAGTLTPGNSPGVLSVNGNLTMASGGNMVWELFANTATQASPAVFDQVLVSGDLVFDGSNGINLNFGTTAAGSTVSWLDPFWSSNQSFLIYDVAGSTTGSSNLSLLNTSFNDATGVALAASQGSFSVSQSGADVLLNYNAIPEPSTGSLLAFGLGGLVLTRLLRRKQI